MSVTFPSKDKSSYFFLFWKVWLSALSSPFAIAPPFFFFSQGAITHAFSSFISFTSSHSLSTLTFLRPRVCEDHKAECAITSLSGIFPGNLGSLQEKSKEAVEALSKIFRPFLLDRVKLDVKRNLLSSTSAVFLRFPLLTFLR
jgi:hypothetical protein